MAETYWQLVSEALGHYQFPGNDFSRDESGNDYNFSPNSSNPNASEFVFNSFADTAASAEIFNINGSILNFPPDQFDAMQSNAIFNGGYTIAFWWRFKSINPDGLEERMLIGAGQQINVGLEVLFDRTTLELFVRNSGVETARIPIVLDTWEHWIVEVEIPGNFRLIKNNSTQVEAAGGDFAGLGPYSLGARRNMQTSEAPGFYDDLIFLPRLVTTEERSFLYTGPEPKALLSGVIPDPVEPGQEITMSPTGWDNYNNGPISLEQYLWQINNQGIGWVTYDFGGNTTEVPAGAEDGDLIRCLNSASNDSGREGWDSTNESTVQIISVVDLDALPGNVIVTSEYADLDFESMPDLECLPGQVFAKGYRADLHFEQWSPPPPRSAYLLKSIRDYLREDTAIRARLFHKKAKIARIYVGRIPQGIPYPAVLINDVGGPASYLLAGESSAKTTHIQIDIYTDFQTDAHEISELIRLAPLSGLRGEVFGSTILSCVLSNERFITDNPLPSTDRWKFRYSCDYQVVFLRPSPRCEVYSHG